MSLNAVLPTIRENHGYLRAQRHKGDRSVVRVLVFFGSKYPLFCEKHPKTSVILDQFTGNLCDFKENQQKWPKIAEFTGQNSKIFLGQEPPDPPKCELFGTKK